MRVLILICLLINAYGAVTRPDFSVLDDTNKQITIDPIQDKTSGSVVPGWVSEQTRVDDDYFYAIGYAASEAENIAIETAHQRALKSLSLYQRSNIETKTEDTVEVNESNGDEKYNSVYKRSSTTTGSSLVRKIRLVRAHVVEVDGKFQYYVELRIHLDDLFPERKLLKAVEEGAVTKVQSIIRQLEADKNEDLLDVAWTSLYEISDNPKHTASYLSYLYEKGQYEKVVITAQAAGFNDSNLIVRKAAQRLHE